jgi:hypothetical protein
LRPTGWILLAALSIVLLRGVLSAAERWRAACVLGCLVLVAISWFALDPRTEGIDPLSGTYETRVLKLFRDMPALGLRIVRNAGKLLEESFPDALLGMPVGPGISGAATAIAILGGIFLVRRRPLWGTFMLLAIALCLVVGPVPRYLLMVQPFLVLAWILSWSWLAERFPRRRDPILAAALLAIALPNFGNCVRLIIEQRSIPFEKHYRHGSWEPIVRLGNALGEGVPEGERVLGPESNVLTFLSGRSVFDGAWTLPARKKKQWPAILEKTRIAWAVFPSTPGSPPSPLQQMMDDGLVAAKGEVTRSGPYWFSRVEVIPTAKAKGAAKSKKPKKAKGGAGDAGAVGAPPGR